MPEKDPPPRTKARVTIEEPGSTARQPSSALERGLSVREGVLGASAPDAARSLPRSPLEAWEAQVRPRRTAGGRLPDLRSAPPETNNKTTNSAADSADPRPLRWAVIGSPSLLRDRAAVRAGLRQLRGYLRVALVGVEDRGALERLADAIGVPLDAVYALLPSAPTLPRALGCSASEIVLLVEPDDASLPGAQRRETTPETFAATSEQLCQQR